MWRSKTERVAKAEIVIQAALGNRGLTAGYLTQIGFTFTEAEVLKFQVYGTVVDGIWRKQRVIVFYDGPPHLRQRQIGKDERIQACLEARGYQVQRYPYRAPISKTRVTEIVDDIEKVLNIEKD